MLTERDSEALSFITVCPCKSKTIQKLFYPSERVASRRLSLMVEYGYCKRFRSSQIDQYFYYTGRRPKQIDHLDLLGKTILWIKKQGYDVVKIRREAALDNIKPDAITIISKNDRFGVLCIEIERFNNSLKKKLQQYEKISQEKKFFESFKIIYVSRHVVTSEKIHIINLKIENVKGC